MPRFITRSIHALLDYPVALGLIALPFILGIGDVNPMAMSLSVTVGIAALVLTLLTDHETGLIRVLPYKVHLAVDFAVGLVFVAAPFVFGFAGIEALYFWVLGGTVLVVVGMHKPELSPIAA